MFPVYAVNVGQEILRLTPTLARNRGGKECSKDLLGPFLDAPAQSACHRVTVKMATRRVWSLIRDASHLQCQGVDVGRMPAPVLHADRVLC